MYADESGCPTLDTTDKTFFVVSSVLIHEYDINALKIAVDDFKKNNFGGLTNAEIHTYEIFKRQKTFVKITRQQSESILDNLYKLIEDLPIAVISVGINKNKIQNKQFNILKYAWKFLVERFDRYLSENDPDQGMIRIDETCGIQEGKIRRIVHGLRKNKIKNKRNNVVEDPFFVDSQLIRGIQLADAVAYCTRRHLNGKPGFDKYWNVIEKKLLKDKDGKYEDYGLKIYP